MQDGQFAWPHLDTLWYQASVYKETGEGHLSLADDILAAIFVYAMALRIEGALWAKMENHFHWNSAETPEEELPDDEIVQIPRSMARSLGNHSRRRRGRR
jgi:hypothetical protein